MLTSFVLAAFALIATFVSVVSTLVGRRARTMRGILIALAFGVVVTGFLGPDTFESTKRPAPRTVSAVRADPTDR